MKFSYRAKNRLGETVRGEIEATDKFALSRELNAQGITVISAEVVGSKRDLITYINEKISRVSFKEKIFLIGNLSEMLSAGLSLTRALAVSGKQTKNPSLKKIIISISDEIDKGGTIAGALAQYSKIFPPTTVAMVEAGEKSGRVPESLKIVSTQMMKTYQLHKRIKGALTYPAIVIGAMVIVAILMLVYIVPTLSATFKELGAQLPFTTRLIIGFSDFITSHYLIGLAIVIATIVGLHYLFLVPKVRHGWHWFILHMPVIGNVVRESNSALTARTLSSLLFSGVEIVEALGITAKVLQNSFYKEIVNKAVIRVPKGAPLSDIFSGEEVEKYYPPFVGEMMSVGEETGKLPDMLLKLAEFYENEVDTVVKDLSTVIEPFIMLIVGAGVGFFALAMIQPIYQIGDSI